MKTNQPNPEKDPIVLEALQAARDVSSPEPAGQRRMQARFIQQIQQVRQENVTFSRKPRLNKRQSFKNNRFLQWRTNTMAVKIIGIIVAIATVLGGAGAGTVYASQSALPDDILYDVKVWSEDTRLDMAQAPEEDLALHLEFADRRIEEMLALFEEGKTPDLELKLELAGHLWMAEQLIVDCDDPIQAQDQVRQRLMTQDQLLTNVPEDALMTQTRSMVRQQLNLMDCELGDEECQQAVCEDGGCMTGEQPMTHEQVRDQLREDQPEGAGSETGNGYTGEYPEPQQGKDEETGNGQGNGSDEEKEPGDGTGNGGNQNENPGPDEDQQPGDGNGNDNGNGGNGNN
jgi:hypothetical protein